MKRVTVVLVALALLAAACGSGGNTASTTAPPTTPADPGTEAFTPGDVVRIDLPKATPNVTAADVDAVVSADAQFGLDLFEVMAGDGNLMISPYSIATALSMLYPGARGTTAGELAAVLHLTVDDQTLHAVRNSIDTTLATPPPPLGDEDSRQPFAIRPANSAWGQGGYPFLDEYLAVLAENYGAGLRLLDYASDPEGSRVTINDWVEDATEDRIANLLPEGSISADTRLVLANAIWFKANWFEQFDPDATSPGTFTLLTGEQVRVPLMRTNLTTSYASTDLFEAVRLPYAGDAAMVVLLPKVGSPAELAADLDVADLAIPWEGRDVAITLPSFEFEAEPALRDALIELGVRAAFDPAEADFSGITGARDLYLSNAFHKTFVAVDEQGTEAAAATALVVDLTSAGGPPPATFTADRPFLFWIEHSSTGAMLFLGQVTNPAP